MARTSRKNLSQAPAEVPKAVTYATWGYTRISADRERSEDSIEGQTAIIQEYVANQPDLELRGMITDLGFSGSDFQRPGYTDLMEKIRRGEVQCVAVKDLSRLGRSYIEVGELLFDVFPAHGVRFISVNDQYDSFAGDAARKKLVILFKNLVNHAYSKDLSQKRRSSVALKRQKGEVHGSIPPYGYLFSDSKSRNFVIESESAEVVKRIFYLRLKGKSIHRIADLLNEEGVPSPVRHYEQLGLRKKKSTANPLWCDNVVGKMLRNELYIGRLAQNKYGRQGKRVVVNPHTEWVIHDDAHPAIIDKALFDAVQQLLDEVGAKQIRHGYEHESNIFVGKIFCTRCGKALRRKMSRKIIRTNYYYSCPRCKKELYRTEGLDAIPSFPLRVLEEAVMEAIRKQMAVYVSLDALIEEVLSSAITTRRREKLNETLQRAQRDSKTAEDRLATAYTHFLAGLLDEKEFNLARAKFEQDKQSAEAKTQHTERALSDYDLEAQRQNVFMTNMRHFKEFTELDRGMVEALIHRIEVEPLTNQYHIVLNFKDECAQLQGLVAESGVVSHA